MSFGRMQSFIDIYDTKVSKDEDGFVITEDVLLFSARAYKETSHGNEAWKNRASFTTATALFRFRRPRSIKLTTTQILVCLGERYNILSVEDIGEKGMYMELLVEKVAGSRSDAHG